MKKLFSRSLLMTFVIALISTIAQGQVTYTASPSGWTSVPGKNITATPINQTVTLHGNLLVARAVISGKNVTFQAKKSDGTIFQNATILYLHENDANGTRKKISRNSAGSSVLNLDFEFDFTSGSKKYCLTLCSNTSSGDQIWYYTSPITITAKSTEVAKPDYTTFTGTNITSNSFEASWSHVNGATSYEINVATDKNYNPIVFNKTTSNNYITVTGLQANTSYYFQVRAKVNGVWGDWSKSISTPVTTTAATPSEVKLTIVGGTYFGSSTLTKGKSASFNIKIKNEGNTDWSGAFYLKGNGTNWIPWGGKSIPAGVTLSLNSSYTPTATGNYTVTLYYQTGGEGDGLPVDKGYFKNPFTVTVTDGQSTKVLDHPDNASLKAVEVGSTSIKVTWGTVKEATDYDVLMKESSSTSYTNGKVGYGTQDYPYYTFTGLIPNTSYTFQVRARNDNAKSDYSKGCVVLTSAAKEENPSLGIFSKHGLAVEAGDPIYKDQSYKYTVGVQNISGKSWSGKLILRNGNEKIKEWKGVNLSSTGGNHFTCNYTPTVTGQQTLCLYYQTGSEGQEMMVKGDDDYENPLYLIVGDKKATTCLLSMRTSIIASSEHHYIDEPVTLQARVYNDDTKDWKGSLYFTINGEIAITTNVPKIPAGGYYDLSRKWQPMEAGKYSIGVSYRKSGDASTEPQPVLLNGQPVSLVVEIKDPDNIPAPEKLKVAFASENLYPQEVREGAAVNYFFRITDENDKPVRNVKLCFACENGYSSFPMETSLSGADGIAVLHVETPVRVKSGETAKFVYDVLKYKDNTKIAFINKADLDPIALKVHKSSIFENVEKVDFTLDLGLGLNAEAGIAQGNINASIPLRFSMKYGDNGDVSKYILGIGLKAGIGASVGTDLLGFPIKGTAGFTLEGGVDYSLSTENLYAAALEGILKLCESWGSSTNSDYDFAVKVLLSWFEHKSKLTWSNSAFISTGIMGDFSFEMPSTFKRGNLLTGKTKVLYDPSAITGMSASYNGKLTYKPKMEETDENNVTTYGEAVSLSNKGSLSAGFSSFAPDILFGSKKTWWRDAGMGSFFENHLKEMLHYSSVKAGFNVEMSFEQEEKFEDESRTKLKELSHGMAIKTGLGITVNDLINPWGKKGDKFSLDASTSSKIKVTSKNNFAGYLQRLANESNTKRETIGNVFPIFADQSCLASPFRMFTVWNSDGIENSLSQLVENVYDPAYHFPLNEALTVTQSNASSLSARLKVPIVDWGWLSLTFDVGLGIATNYRPTYSYYSVADKRFFPVVLQPVSTIQSIVNSALQRLADGISGAFDDEDQEEIKKEADEMQHYMTSEVYAGTMVDMNFDNYQRPFVANSPALAARAMRRHPALLSKPQTDICTLGFNINNGEQNFDEGTTLSFSHYYPDGDLFAVTDQGDTLFVVSEVTTLGAMRDGSNLQTSHRGSFRLDTYVGNDDLSPFGLSEDTQLDIYHAVKGTDVWHYVGKAGTPVMVDSLGQYILATSIHNDHTAPEVTMDFNPQSRILNIALSDNIGVRVGTLQVMINNELRKAEAQNEYNYSVELTDDDMKYLIEVYATVNDLAGNKGELYQMFNLDMPQRPSETQQPGDDFEVTDISILDNVVYLAPVEVHAGEEATLSVKMKNNVNAEGFGFDLYLPYGMNFKLDADGFPEAYLSTERTSARKTNTFESVIRPDGALRVMAASTNGSVISGSDGEVALVTILVDKDVQPGIYPLLLREIAISDSDARSYDTDAVRTTITVLDGASNIHEVMSPRHFDNHIYNLQGQRVTTLTKGIYIKNGRKFVVR